MQIPAFSFSYEKRLTAISTRAKIAQELNSTCTNTMITIPEKELTWQERIQLKLK